MKHRSIAILSGFLLITFQATIVMALNITLDIHTPMYENQEQAMSEGQRIAGEIQIGKNKIALSDAALECPEDNTPRYHVRWLQIHQYWVPQANSFVLRYSAQISYDLQCDQ
ncbi:MAG: hypothetical protein HQM12_11425 [SAR324 cluster bacterium]|nr:hypothetical protein [SAR324 cluster bacterium]MBF0352221.1 hypothetical protein [SAR324 cluster bacterium]